MSEDKEVHDEMIKFKVRTFISLIISVIMVTNSFSIIYQKILRGEEEVKYNKERADRIADRKLKEAKDYHDRLTLERQLKDCKNALK